MANIENLNFEIILQDKQFRDRVQKDIALAHDLNLSLSAAFNFNKKVKIDQLTRITTETKKMTAEMERFNKAAAKDVTKRFTQMNTHIGTTNNLMRTLGQLTGATFSVLGLRRFLSTLIDVTGQFEVQKMALRNMLQDIDGADKIFQDLYNFSSESTYRFSELAKYAKQLAAFNIDQSNLLETTKMLGDVASGVGVSMDRLILAYGHVKSSGFLRGIQLRSFSQNGVPVLEELSKMFTEIEGKAVSLGDVFDKMMKREIGFEMVEEAFRRMTSEGGKFYQMQEVLAKTLAGQINILKGKWENLMYAIGESQDSILKGVVGALTRIVSSTESFGNAIKKAIVALGTYKAAVLIVAYANDALTASQIRALTTMTNMGRVIATVLTSPYTYLALAIVGVTAAVYKQATAFDKLGKIQEVAAQSIQNFADKQSEENAELKRLVDRMKLAKGSTEDYNAAKGELEKRFGPYLQQLRNEGKDVEDLANLYDNLASKIEDANKARFRDEAMEGIGEAYGAAIKQVDAALQKSIKQSGVSSIAVQEAMRGYVRGYVTREAAIAAGVPESYFSSVTYNGPYSQGSYNNALGLDAIRNKYVQAGDEMQAAKDEVEDALKVIFGTDGAGDETQNVIKIASVVDGIKKIDAELAGLRKKAQSSGGITEDEQKRIESLTEDREEQVKLYKSIMGQDYDKAVKSSAKVQEDAQKKERDGIKAQITLLEKYRDTREKLEPFFGSDTDSQLADIFGKDTDYATLDAQIKTLCDDLRKLGEEGVQAAEQIEARLGLDKASSIIQAQKALQKWQATLRKWQKDWGAGDYHGIEGDIDKVIREYNNEDSEITQDYLDSLNEIMEAHWGDAEAIQREVDALDKLVAARRAANSTAQQEKLNGLASKYVKENTQNLNLRDWGDKSIRQVRDLYKTLSELASGEVVLDKTMTGRLVAAGLKIEDFAKLAKGEFSELAENAKQELEKKLGQTLREIISDLNAVAQAVQDFGDATGNLHLASFAEDFMQITSVVGNVAERVLAGDIPGAISAGLSAIVTGFFQAKAAAAQFQASLREAREEARRSGMSEMLDAGTLFGTNNMGAVRNALAVMQKARASMKANATPGGFNSKRGFWDYFWNGGARVESFSLAQMAESVGRDLYDAYGNLNADTLQTILDTYEGLGQAEREWITRAINDSDAYTEAMEQLKGVVESVFGEIASSSSDAIVDQWKERGDAALDYADILDDVATRYAKMMVESEILDRVLTPEKASEIVDMFSRGDSEGAMERIAEDMAAIQGMAPVFEQILTAFDPYFNRAGAESASNSLAAGINKELVEGNSSLIASYINAMRADLSVIRGFQSTGWQDIRLIREYAPTYADYMARIEANTYDNAQAAQSILARLQSIITPSTNGGSAVRTTR